MGDAASDTRAAPRDAGCVPNCAATARDCGDDGCGGSCGRCLAGHTCEGRGVCTRTTCVGCGSWQRCNDRFVCELNPAARWSLAIVSGTVSDRTPAGLAWDAFGGLPDPYVCITVRGFGQRCTDPRPDTLAPVWSHDVVSAIMTGPTTADLLVGIDAIYADEDSVVDDDICGSSTIVPTAEDFARGSLRIGCPPTGPNSWTLRLTPQ